MAQFHRILLPKLNHCPRFSQGPSKITVATCCLMEYLTLQKVLRYTSGWGTEPRSSGLSAGSFSLSLPLLLSIASHDLSNMLWHANGRDRESCSQVGEGRFTQMRRDREVQWLCTSYSVGVLHCCSIKWSPTALHYFLFQDKILLILLFTFDLLHRLPVKFDILSYFLLFPFS